MKPGETLGPYRVLEKLGEGGMGEVYRARDTQLKRDVALKVLPAAVAADRERLARFQREAELLAALNHPHIAQIYGLAEAEGVRALVMELVEGPTLAERIARGAVPLDETLAVARQLADALDYAHERGIVHRDLKPANIKLTADGAVKVLNFGLAKALSADAARATAGDALGNSPTTTSPAMTRAGIVLGTAAYMSPEQARGAVVDKRADIWAFGVVLFEMLTGRACFEGETVTDILAAVVKGEPDWGALPAETPRRITDLVRRCLAKDRRQRLRDIGDARLAIDDAASGPIEATPPVRRASAASRAVPWAVALVMAMVAAWLAVRPIRVGEPAERQARRSRLSVPELIDDVNGSRSVAISPDGSQLAYAGGRFPATRIYYRQVTDLDFRPLGGTEGAAEPFFSPDGRWLGFSDGARWKRLRLAGGQVEAITAIVGELTSGASWEADQKIYFSENWGSGVSRTDAMGSDSAPESVLRPDTGHRERGLVWPQRLPVEDLVLFTVQAGNIASMNDARLAIASPSKPQNRCRSVPCGGPARSALPNRGHVESVGSPVGQLRCDAGRPGVRLHRQLQDAGRA